jgi:hypothetical protein
MVRAGNSTQFREMPVTQATGQGYSLTITPDVHRNGSVSVYFEAGDVSGHLGRLGSEEDPLVFERKGLFKRILGN